MKITPGIAEIVGIYIGDGHIYRKDNKFQIGFTGNPITDLELFERLKELIKKEFDKDINFKIRARGLRTAFRSKIVSNLLVNELGLTYGKGKSERVIIPEKIASDWDLARHTIRGIMDTDGSFSIERSVRKAGQNRQKNDLIKYRPKILLSMVSERSIKYILSNCEYGNLHIIKANSALRGEAFRFSIQSRPDAIEFLQ